MIAGLLRQPVHNSRRLGLFPLPGIPELGVRPIDPLFVDIFNFSEVSGKFRINLQMTNVSMDGLKDYVVTGVR